MRIVRSDFDLWLIVQNIHESILRTTKRKKEEKKHQTKRAHTFRASQESNPRTSALIVPLTPSETEQM